MNLPIRVRLTAWYAVLLGAIIVALGAFLVLRLRTDLQDGIDRDLRRAATADRPAATRREGTEEFLDVSAHRAAARRIGRRRCSTRPAACC